MPQRRKVSTDVEKVKQSMKKSTSIDEYRRLQCVYLADEKPEMTLKEIATITLYSESTVKKIVSEFHKIGFKSVKDRRGGRFRENMSLEEESKLLKRFIEQSESGKLICATIIKIEYEKAIGRQVNKSVIYRLLSRHGYRQIIPYKRHPKSNQEEQATFKKTSNQ
jgi:transposase